MSFQLPLLAAATGYLLGSIPFAVIIARRHGVDIFKAGSGNPGATNVKRVCGKKAGNLVFALDALKGLVAAAWPWLAAPTLAGNCDWFSGDAVLYARLTGFAGAVLGHCFSIFLKFRGGKGIAVSVGGLCGALPECLLVSAAVWLITYFTTRIVSIASLLAALDLPIASGILWGTKDPRFLLCLILAILVFYTHRANIGRIIRGEEFNFHKKKNEE